MAVGISMGVSMIESVSVVSAVVVGDSILVVVVVVVAVAVTLSAVSKVSNMPGGIGITLAS